jgi:hypothetical protein
MSAPYYTWVGTLPTIDAMGKSVCSTNANPVTITAKTPINPSPTPGRSTDREDPYGFVYSLNPQVSQAASI